MISPVIFAGGLTIFAGALPPWAPPWWRGRVSGSVLFCSLTSVVVVCNTPWRAITRLEVASPAQARWWRHAASSLIIAGGPVVLRPVRATPCLMKVVWNMLDISNRTENCSHVFVATYSALLVWNSVQMCRWQTQLLISLTRIVSCLKSVLPWTVRRVWFALLC